MSYIHTAQPVMAAQMEALAAYRDAQLTALCQKLQLDEILGYIQEPQFETHRPYHNPAHCKRVALRTAELLMASGELDDFHGLQFDLQMGIVAALFHDFGHTGRHPDSINIEIAVAGMMNAECVIDYFGEGNESLGYIAEAIRCTEFKQGFPIEPYTRVQKALRDADVMESCEPHGVKYVMFDLTEEMNIDVADAIPLQIGFLQQVKMYTEAGAMMWEDTLEHRIAAVGALGLQENPPVHYGAKDGL